MAFVVLYDACVLHPNTLRDLLIRVAQAGLVQARWTDTILDETFASVAQRRPDIPPANLERTRKLMCEAVRDCLVTGFEPIVEVLSLPDPDDRHVLAAAIRAGAQVIVTDNLRDFPAAVLEQWNIEAKSADDFVLDQLHLDAPSIYVAVQQIADARRNPPQTFADILDALERNGLVASTAFLRS
jgi:predicted nucleic acid-binding protein